MALKRGYILPNFTYSEIACKCGCGSIATAPGFLQALQGARDAYGSPFVPNSVVRCAVHNAKVGGHARSLHLDYNSQHKYKGTTLPISCCAVDLPFPEDHPRRDEMIEILWDRGWRVGLHSRFLHGDMFSMLTDAPQIKFNY